MSQPVTEYVRRQPRCSALTKPRDQIQQDPATKVPADHYGGLVVFPLIDHSCDVRMIAQLPRASHVLTVSPLGMIE